jgi:hypothetical protein
MLETHLNSLVTQRRLRTGPPPITSTPLPLIEVLPLIGERAGVPQTNSVSAECNYLHRGKPGNRSTNHSRRRRWNHGIELFYGNSQWREELQTTSASFSGFPGTNGISDRAAPGR